MSPALMLALTLACGPKSPEPAEGDAPPEATTSSAEVDAPPEATTSSAEAPTPPEVPSNPDRPAPTKGERACEGIDGRLNTWLAQPEGAKVSVDAEGRASVVVALTDTSTTLPDTFEETQRRESEAKGTVAYGWIASEGLCALAGTDGVGGVSAADTASPKPDAN